MNPLTTLRVASVQLQHKANDKDYNLAKIHQFIEMAASEKVNLLVFPEMCITGYWHVPKLPAQQVYALSEKLADSASLKSIKQKAQQYAMAIGVGLIERDNNNNLYNTWVVCMPDGSLQKHRKLHAFEHPVICSGDQYTVFDTPWGVKIGILICWDNNLVENARATALLGADILLAPHQTGGTHSRSPHSMKPIPMALWENRQQDPQALQAAFQGEHGKGWLMRWLPARAHDNGMFIIFSNGVGRDEEEVRTGNAMVIDPYGRIVKESYAIEDDMVVTDIDLTLLPESTGRRWLTGRRPELYQILTTRQGNEQDPISVRFGNKD
ncbi:TPA: nitrilase family protein [Proteus mirabilis]|uniref:Acyltransferase n=1 Tax=Proteus mirabilis TaxID=584 RepID=A0AAJ1DI30_PROMI|nr:MULTISPECIES: nitrilase family protein [Proteus]ARX32960.1 acyltransferase [Proteus mirabilis]AUU40861.1 acyltransferase [Proteus mirabilis]EJD6086373.1 nitrilase family protein [Proteus mirabilis]EJD6316888.1 nitrilase family protein [Proteus mirabilis]EJD6321184.1 nitrilase family protein [Proteus mirabilis]